MLIKNLKQMMVLVLASSIMAFTFVGCGDDEDTTEEATIACVSRQHVQVDDLFYDLFETGSATVVQDSSYTRLLSVKIPQNINVEGAEYTVTEVDDSAFKNCTQLSTVTMANSVTAVGEYAFYNCVSMASITLSNTLTTIGESAFFGCSYLNSITLPNTVVSIGEKAFRNCMNLKSVAIPNSVTSIAANTFYYCEQLQSVTIPASVTSIGNQAFAKCMSLTSIVCEATVPPTTGTSSFARYSATLYVPQSALTAYKTSTYAWSQFETISAIK